MNNNFEIFVNMDNEELYSKTYITYTNLDDIKNKNFSAFTRYKFNGFIDILTKRLNLDLEDLKNEANEYFDQYEPKVIIEIEEQLKDDLRSSKESKLPLMIGQVVYVLVPFDKPTKILTKIIEGYVVINDEVYFETETFRHPLSHVGKIVFRNENDAYKELKKTRGEY